MNKEWRPDCWKRYESYNSSAFPHQGGLNFDVNGKTIIDDDSFEQGASAMLKALRERGHHVDGDASFTSVGEHCTLSNHENTGNYVFIPNDLPEATP